MVAFWTWSVLGETERVSHVLTKALENEVSQCASVTQVAKGTGESRGYSSFLSLWLPFISKGLWVGCVTRMEGKGGDTSWKVQGGEGKGNALPLTLSFSHDSCHHTH